MQFKGDTLKGNPAIESRWPFCPTAVRVHPFTAFENDDDQWQLKAHIELLDLQQDPAKGLGKIRIELYAIQKNQPNPVFDQQIAHQVFDISDISKSHRQYDRITRTYLFNLPIKSIPVTNKRLQLVVHFTDIYKQQMTSKMTLLAPKQKNVPPANQTP